MAGVLMASLCFGVANDVEDCCVGERMEDGEAKECHSQGRVGLESSLELGSGKSAHRGAFFLPTAPSGGERLSFPAIASSSTVELHFWDLSGRPWIQAF